MLSDAHVCPWVIAKIWNVKKTVIEEPTAFTAADLMKYLDMC